MKYEDAKATLLLEYCAERCGSQQKRHCENCEIEAAIKAVEKQIPKKPEIEGKYYICPVCGVYQETSEGNPPYCINCGQAIDFGKE